MVSLDLHLPTINSWLERRGPMWRVATWWPSDTRGAMQRSLLHLLRVAHAEQLDVEPLVANLAEEHRGVYRRRLRRLAARLKEGTSLVDALEQTPDALSDESVLAIRFATQTGTLTPTYDNLLDHFEITSGLARIKVRQALIYFVITSLVLLVAIGFLMTFIVPMLQQMREEFGMQSSYHGFPWTFDFLIAVSNHFTDYFPLWLLLILSVAWLAWSAPSRRFFRRVFAARWSRGVAEKRKSEILDLLSIAVQAGRPLPAAISTLARYHFDQSVRNKLLFARNEIEHGTDAWQSLADAKLLTHAESKALNDASSTESRAWTMRRLADAKRRTVARRADDLASLAQPAVTLVLAFVVLLVASAMIGFLTHLIQWLA
ncbi:MAG: type II secretion system F family protein [Rubripirellula sp.]